MTLFSGLCRYGRHHLAATTATALLTLSGCTTLLSTDTAQVAEAHTSAPDATAGTAPENAEQPPLRPFEPQTLFDLLVADFAGIHKQYGLQLNRYFKQAFFTRDPGLAEQATWLAVQLNAAKQAMELSGLWAELAPENTDANRVRGYYLAYAGQLTKALPHALLPLRNDDKEAILAVSRQVEQVTAAQRQQLQQSIHDLTGASGRFHDLVNHPQVALLEATLLLLNGDPDAAIQRASIVQEPEVDRDSALLLQATAIFQQQGLEANLAFLEQAVNQHPNSKRLRLQLARQWATKDDERSRTELTKLVEQFPDDDQLRYALALLHVQKESYQAASLLFEQLLTSTSHQQAAHYQLGVVRERQQQLDDAISHYQQVTASEFYSRAVSGQLRLLSTTKRHQELNQLIEKLLADNPDKTIDVYLDVAGALASNNQDQALTLLNTALTKHPENPDLLYSRSLLHEQLGNTSGSHDDLRTVIASHPDRADALNALGYSLTNSGNPADYPEAHQLISKALTLAPDNPAILDSMGWALFRLNKLDEALPYLRQAFELLPDPEVAAHLGEVLWRQGKQAEALSIWQQVLADNPDAEHIINTMERLGASQLSQSQLKP